MSDELGKRGCWIKANDREVALCRLSDVELGVAIESLWRWIRENRAEARKRARSMGMKGKLRFPDIEIAEEKLRELHNEKNERVKVKRLVAEGRHGS